MTLKNYSSNFELIKDLIDGEVNASPSYYITIGNFNGAASSNYAKIKDIYSTNLLLFMHDENSANTLGTWGVRQSIFPDENHTSVGEYINSNADLRDGLLNKTYGAVVQFYATQDGKILKTSDDIYYTFLRKDAKDHWNESLLVLQKYFDKYWDGDTEKEIVEKDGKIIDSGGTITSKQGKLKFRLDDIIKADAGNYFGDQESKTNFLSGLIKNADQQQKAWVRSWFNIDGDTYSSIRGGDKNIEKLNQKNNLQFTRFKEKSSDYLLNLAAKNTPLQKYIRLIMPEYQRIVEVEDLDRNFWVIAQCLGGLSAFLLGDDSPLPNILRGILDEIIQLWENVFYLWLGYKNYGNKKEVTDVKIIMLPINPDDLNDYVKFDNFKNDNNSKITQVTTSPNTDNLKAIWDRVHILKDQYNESQLIIVPEVRSKNYKNNLYSMVLYPGIIYYNRNVKGIEGQVNYIPFSLTKKNTEIRKSYLFPDLNGNGIVDAVNNDPRGDAAILLSLYGDVVNLTEEEVMNKLLTKGTVSIDEDNNYSYSGYYQFIENHYMLQRFKEKREKIQYWLRSAARIGATISYNKTTDKYTFTKLTQVDALSASLAILGFASSGYENTPEGFAQYYRDTQGGEGVVELEDEPIITEISIYPPNINMYDGADSFVSKTYPFLDKADKIKIKGNTTNFYVDNTFSKNKETYYAGIETRLNIPSGSIKNINGTISFEGSLDFYDVSKRIIGEETLIGRWKFKDGFNISQNVCALEQYDFNNIPPSSLEKDTKSGYYLGECVSCAIQ